MIDKNIDNYRATSKTNSLLQPQGAKLVLFRVINVRPTERTIDIEYIHSNIQEKKVNYMSPFLNSRSGMDFIPSKGDIGVIASTAISGRVILGFLSSSERSSGIKLLESELLLKSKLDAVMKYDSGGNIIISTQGGTNVYMGEDGRYVMSTSNSSVHTDATEEFSGVDEEGNFKFSKDFFEDYEEVDFTDINSLLETILQENVPDIQERKPILNISAINKIKKDGTKEKIELNFDESDEVVAYSISVNDKESGNEISSISFDKSGNIEIKGNKLSFKVSEIIHK